MYNRGQSSQIWTCFSIGDKCYDNAESGWIAEQLPQPWSEKNCGKQECWENGFLLKECCFNIVKGLIDIGVDSHQLEGK